MANTIAVVVELLNSTYRVKKPLWDLVHGAQGEFV